jgi:tRNA threonylcarbamoyladenosine biosynthesis protein TsaB
MHLQPEVMPHAAQVARLAAGMLAEGKAVAPRDAQPIYLRNKVALTTVERQAKVAA